MARNASGRIRACYLSPLRREYFWDGSFRIIKMSARRTEFQGRTGLLNPGSYWGLTAPKRERMVVQESVINFRSVSELYYFLWTENLTMDWVYDNNGLTVGWAKNPARYEVDVDVWQLLVNGKRPETLRGARPNAITATVMGHRD
jgi:hypothetical protein